MIEKDEVVISQTLPPKLQDTGEFTISCNIGKVSIPHDLCDVGSSINVMPLKTVKELNTGEITPSNITFTLTDSSITQSVGILRDVSVHVDRLVFLVDFVMLNKKGDSRGSVILGNRESKD